MELKDAKQALEDDNDELLIGECEVTGIGTGISGWNTDIEIFDGPEAEKQLEMLRLFLRQWPVLDEPFWDVNGQREDVFNRRLTSGRNGPEMRGLLIAILYDGCKVKR